MKPTLYTFGYAGTDPKALQRTAATLDAIIADIRFKPASRDPRWRQPYLQKLLGDDYVHVDALGNRNYKGGPIDLVDVPAAITEVGALLERRSVILICVCADLQRCHRLTASEQMRDALDSAARPVLLKHLTANGKD